MVLESSRERFALSLFLPAKFAPATDELSACVPLSQQFNISLRSLPLGSHTPPARKARLLLVVDQIRLCRPTTRACVEHLFVAVDGLWPCLTNKYALPTRAPPQMSLRLGMARRSNIAA